MKILVLLMFKLQFSHKTEGFDQSSRPWTLMIALSSKRLYDPYDMTRRKYYNITSQSISINICAKRQLTRALSPPPPLLKETITCHILYRSRPNDVHRGGGALQGPLHFQNSLQVYFTAKCDNLILRVRFKVGFNSHEYRLTRIPYIVLSFQNKLVGCTLGVPISYNCIYLELYF